MSGGGGGIGRSSKGIPWNILGIATAVTSSALGWSTQFGVLSLLSLRRLPTLFMACMMIFGPLLDADLGASWYSSSRGGGLTMGLSSCKWPYVPAPRKAFPSFPPLHLGLFLMLRLLPLLGRLADTTGVQPGGTSAERPLEWGRPSLLPGEG